MRCQPLQTRMSGIFTALIAVENRRRTIPFSDRFLKNINDELGGVVRAGSGNLNSELSGFSA